MAVNDFSNQNIQDTYQRVVQTDGTNLADGTGSLLPISFDGNNVKISGSIFATEYSVTSSITNIVIATKSGSTEFGNSQDDSHTFIGNITASSNITASGLFADKIRAGSYIGSSVFDIAAGIGGIDTDGAMSCTGFSNSSTSTFGGRIVMTGGVGSYLETTSYVSASEFRTTGHITTGHITASGNISASGRINVGIELTSPLINTNKILPPSDSLQIGTDDGLQAITFNGNVTALTASILNDLTINNNNIRISGNITENQRISGSTKISYHSQKHEFASTNTSAASQHSFFMVSGDSHFTSHITTSGNISSSGVIHGDSFRVNGSRINKLTTSQTSTYDFPDGGISTFGSITASGDISASVTITADAFALNGNKFAHLGPDETHFYIGLTGQSSLILTNITASGDISASGDLFGNNLTAAEKVNTDRLLVDQIDEYNGGKGITISHNVTASGDISSSGLITGKINTTDSNTNAPHYFMLQTAVDTLPLISNGMNLNPSTDVLTVGGGITSSGNISSSGNVITSKTGLPGLQYINYNTDGIEINVDDGNAIKIDKDSGTVAIGTSTIPSNITLHVEGDTSINGSLSASGNLTANNITGVTSIESALYTIDGVNAIDYTSATHLFGSNNSFTKLRSTKGIEMTAPVTASSNISASGDVIATGTGSFGRLEATSDVALQLLNNQNIVFENAAGTEFGQIKMNTDDQMLFQNLRSNKNIFIRAGNAGNEGNVIIQKGGTEDAIAEFGNSADLNLTGNFTASGNISASGNIKANYVETAKIPIIQYISTEATSVAQGRLLAASAHNNETDSKALEWDTPLFEDTDFFETGSASPTTSGVINTFAVKQTGRYEVNCGIAFRTLSGARPGLNLGIFTSSTVTETGSLRAPGVGSHGYSRFAGTQMGTSANIANFVLQLGSGSAISMKVDFKEDWGGISNTVWSGSLSYFNMKKIG